MKLLLFILSMMFSGVAVTQDVLTPKVIVEQKNIFIGINFSADYCFRTVINNSNDNSINFIVDSRNKYEIPKFGYTGGLNILFDFSNQLAIEGGIQYSNKGFARKKSELYFGGDIDPRYGFVYDTSGSSEIPSSIKFRYNYLYLDIPIRAIYTFDAKRLRFTTSIGFVFNYLIKSTQTAILEFANGDIKHQTDDQWYDDYHKINLSPTVSLGIDYKLSEKIRFKAEPTFRYGVIKISDTPVSSFLWNGGLNVSCYYKLK